MQQGDATIQESGKRCASACASIQARTIGALSVR